MDLQAAEDLARNEIAKHAPAGTTFRFNRKAKTFGQCHFSAYTRNARIELSAPLTEANDEYHVLDTILHEIAHAVAGPYAGHNAQWKAIASSLGAQPVRQKDGQSAPTKYSLICPICDKHFPRHRKTQGTYLCNVCPREEARLQPLVWHVNSES